MIYGIIIWLVSFIVSVLLQRLGIVQNHSVVFLVLQILINICYLPNTVFSLYKLSKLHALQNASKEELYNEEARFKFYFDMLCSNIIGLLITLGLTILVTILLKVDFFTSFEIITLSAIAFSSDDSEYYQTM